MKYKIISIIVVISIIVGSLLIQGYESPKNRYHQHIEAQDKMECTNHDDSVFCTHLPLMNIVTDKPIADPYKRNPDGSIMHTEFGSSVRNDEMVSGTLQYFDSKDSNNHLTDVPTIDTKIEIRIRGASSRAFDKKGYLIHIKEDNLIDDKDISFSGMAEDNSWVLNGPFLDKTLIRNYMCYNLAGELMDYAPNVRFTEVFINGEYQGLYLLIEKIKFNEEGRVKLTKTDPKYPTTSYIVLIDRISNDPTRVIETYGSLTALTNDLLSNSSRFEILYPSKTLTSAQRDYIEKDISTFEKVITSYDYKDKKYGYNSYIDVDSFVNYYLLNEFTLNYDSMNLSTFVYKDIRGKLGFVVWDFNSAFDYYRSPFLKNQTFLLQNAGWYKFLFKDKKFTDAVVQRYYDLRKSYFDEDYLMNYIDETIEYLGPAIDRNYEKWGYSFLSDFHGENYDYLKPIERNPRSYDEAVKQLKDCIHERLKYMDKNIENLYLLSHDSINKRYNHQQGGN